MKDTLQQENTTKEREIKRLNKDMQQCEQTIINLRNELSMNMYHTPEVAKKDAEVMAGMCCAGSECSDMEPVKDFSVLLREEAVKYKEHIQKIELDLKSSNDKFRAVRRVNVALSMELQALRGVCAALDEHGRAASLRARLKDDMIREMRRQLKHAKAKIREVSNEMDGLKDYVSGDHEFSRSNSVCYEEQCKAATSTPNSTSGFPATISEEMSNVSTIELSAEDGCLEDIEQRFIQNCAAFQQHTCPGGCPASTASTAHSGHSICTQVPKKSDKAEECGRRTEEVLNKTESYNVSCTAETSKSEGCTQTFKSVVDSSCGGSTYTKSEVATQSRSKSQESVAASCATDSGSGCDAATRADFYHNKLLSTMQILQNKEETVRVQGESLAVAEARIATLTVRVAQMRRELDRKAHELRSLRRIVDSNKFIEKMDVSLTTQTQEVDSEKSVVSTLQNNLSVIEELYRECFYETAKQEELMEMLRKSYLDVRLMDKEKSDKINRLQEVINTQKWSLEQCQDIAMEVENLKMEISNFLNNSNNDSGMWERSEDSFAVEVGEDLHDIMDQLVQLRDMLTGDCTCGLLDENMRLKQRNETLETQIGELRQSICDLETTLIDRDNVEEQHNKQLLDKEMELQSIRQQLAELDDKFREQTETCDTLRLQLQQAQVLLNDKTEELMQLQQQYTTQEATTKQLKENLKNADQIIKENCKIRCEVTQLTRQVALWRSQLEESEARMRMLEQQLQCARTDCRNLDTCYREKAARAEALRARLQQAQARGAALCAESGRAAAAVGHWVRRGRAHNRKLQEKIKEQEELIATLQQRSVQGQNSEHSSDSDESCKCITRIQERLEGVVSELLREAGRAGGRVGSCAGGRAGSCAGGRAGNCAGGRAGSCAGGRAGSLREPAAPRAHSSPSHGASCSSAPRPPKRLLKKTTPSCEDARCLWVGLRETDSEETRESMESRTGAGAGVGVGVGAARAGGSGAGCGRMRDARHLRVARTPREVSPTEDLLERMEHLHEAQLARHRRRSRSQLTADRR